jgi:hypothetical protein
MYNSPSVSGNSFTRRAALRFLGVAAAGQLAIGHKSFAWAALSNPSSTEEDSAIIANAQPAPSGTTVTGTMQVTDTKIGAIGSRYLGLGYEKSAINTPCFTGTNKNLIQLMKWLGPGFLHLGGNTADALTWVASGSGGVSGQVSPADITRLGAFLAATGWQVIYSINFARSSPSVAADEVSYAADILGSSLHSVEFGNEPDLYFNHISQYANWTFSDFAARWKEFYDAVHAKVPWVKITGPATAGNAKTWTIPFSQQLGSYVEALSQHYYRGDALASTSTIEQLVSADARLPWELGGLAAAGAKIGKSFRITETNSYYNQAPSGVQDAYGSALWVIDHLFNLAKLGCISVCVEGGQENRYTPIEDNHGAVLQIRPEYYGLRMFATAGKGDLVQTTLSVGGMNVTGYAIHQSGAKHSLMLVNKDPYQNIQMTVTCPQSISSANLVTLTGPSLSALTGETMQSANIGRDGIMALNTPYGIPASGNTVSCYVNAKSAALIRVS